MKPIFEKSPELLYISLNYLHNGLSMRQRAIFLTTGVISITIGIATIVTGHFTDNIYSLLETIIVLLLGLSGVLFTPKNLPFSMRKFVRISENSIKFKTHAFVVRRKFLWDDIEQIEINDKAIRIHLEYSSKPRIISLRSVSYNDFSTLNKQVVDMCMARNIDMI
ncbi:MAG: hypothetical protein MJ069_05320 [Salinivirgaceae bacterium]|nr:hypothetical protein [Salinivirgaceae bacterium]